MPILETERARLRQRLAELRREKAIVERELARLAVGSRWANVDKLLFYGAHEVDELLIVDPQGHSVHWLALEGSEYQPVERSRVIEMSQAELAERIDRPSP